MKYDEVELEPLTFQDDIINCSEDIEDAQLAIDKIEDLLETKLLTLNVDKSSFIIAGARRAKQAIAKKLEENPIKLKMNNMKQAKEEKYLGI